MSKRPKELGPKFSLEIIEFLEYCLPIYQIGNFVFLYSLNLYDIEWAKWGIVALVLSLLNAILPMEEISKILEGKRSK